MIGHEKAFLHGKLFPGNKTGGPVHLPVPRPFKPFEGLPVQTVNITEHTCHQKVLLHIFHYVLDLAFGLGIGLMAEHRLEMLLPDKRLELPCQHQVPQVLPGDQHPVLVIKDLFRFPSEILKSTLMCIDGEFRVKGRRAKKVNL